jgi:hypothetical protein
MEQSDHSPSATGSVKSSVKICRQPGRSPSGRHSPLGHALVGEGVVSGEGEAGGCAALHPARNKKGITKEILFKGFIGFTKIYVGAISYEE